MREKEMLIKQNKKNIFDKVIRFIKTIFFKKEEQAVFKTEKQVIKDESFISGLKQGGEILSLQERFESGEIKESNLTEEQKNKLIDLYKKQISELKHNIRNYDRDLEMYQEKILIAKRKLNNQ